jgi:hypothetical protein
MRELYRARRRPDGMPKILALFLVLLAVAACGGVQASAPVIGPAPTPGPPEPTAVPGSSSAPAQAGVLVIYETRGGECPGGPCGERIEVYADGTVKYQDGPLGQLSPELLGRLEQAIAVTDWEAVLAVPFEGECPVNFDGQEQVYTFSVDGQAVTVASCTTAIDPAAEPFATVQEVLLAPGG